MHRKKLLLGFNLWDAEDRTRGLLWRGLGDPLCRQVREGTGVEAPRRPLRRFPGTYTGHPLYSVRKVLRHGLAKYRRITDSILGPGGRPGHRSGQSSGSHEPELAREATHASRGSFQVLWTLDSIINVAGRSLAWACSGRGAVICVRVSSSVNHL
jgi:hypothetical protein